MNRSTRRLLVLLVVVTALAATAYIFRVRLQAWIWHLRHGNSATVASYIVPVPNNWYVVDEGPTGLLLIRLDTADASPTKKLKSHASVLFSTMPMLASDQALARKISVDSDAMRRQASDSVLQLALNSKDGQLIQCVGGYRPGSNGNFDVEPSGWVCNSTGIEAIILATDADMHQVWEIMAGIRKKT